MKCTEGTTVVRAEYGREAHHEAHGDHVFGEQGQIYLYTMHSRKSTFIRRYLNLPLPATTTLLTLTLAVNGCFERRSLVKYLTQYLSQRLSRLYSIVSCESPVNRQFQVAFYRACEKYSLLTYLRYGSCAALRPSIARW